MKIFAIIGPFVPTNEPMTLLPYKQLRHANAQIDVCALSYTIDKSLQVKLSEDPLYKKFNVKYVGKYNDALFSIHNVNVFKAISHVKKYIKNCVMNFEKEQYDYLYTSAFPAFTHTAGYEIKKKYPNVKWIANFTDPINHSPYKYDQETYKNYMFIQKICFKLYSHFYVNDECEKIAFENADFLVFICEEQRDFMIEQYEKYYGNLTKEALIEKSIIFPLCFVKEWHEFNHVKAKKDDTKIRIAHFGRVYGLRKIDSFIFAVSELVREYPDLRKKLQIEQYGEFKLKDIKLIKKLGLSDIFRINKKIGYEECLEIMNEVDVALIFDTIMDENSWQPYLPSKIMEYSLLKKNVFAVTTNKSPTARIMNQSNAIYAINDIHDIKEKLMLVINGVESKIDYAYTTEEASRVFLEKTGLNHE